jgi:hypothetical protein
MTTTTTGLVPDYLDLTRLAVASFLARHREPDPDRLPKDLRTILVGCQQHDVQLLRATRGELEMYVCHLESRRLPCREIARRFGTVATFYKYAVIDRLIPATPPRAVTRPKVVWGRAAAQCIASAGVRCPAGCGAQLYSERPRPDLPARDARPAGIRSLRDSDITDIRYESGYRLLRVLGRAPSSPTSHFPSRY